MAYDHGFTEHVMTASGGAWGHLMTTSGIKAKWGPGYAKQVIRAISVVPLTTKVVAGVVSFRVLATAGVTTSGTVIDTITLTTANRRGKPMYVKGLNTTVSEGSEVHMLVTTLASGQKLRACLYVTAQPADPANNTRMTESA